METNACPIFYRDTDSDANADSDRYAATYTVAYGEAVSLAYPYLYDQPASHPRVEHDLRDPEQRD